MTLDCAFSKKDIIVPLGEGCLVDISGKEISYSSLQWQDSTGLRASMFALAHGMRVYSPPPAPLPICKRNLPDVLARAGGTA